MPVLYPLVLSLDGLVTKYGLPLSAVVLSPVYQTTEQVNLSGKGLFLVAPNRTWRRMTIVSPDQHYMTWEETKPFRSKKPGDAVTVVENHTDREQESQWAAVYATAPDFRAVDIFDPSDGEEYYAYSFDLLIPEGA